MIGKVFHHIDTSLAWLLADHARLAIWAAVSGVLSMLIYKCTSPQQTIRELSLESSTVRQAIARHEGEFSEALPLIYSNLALALRRVRIAVIPSLLAGLPIIVCLVGLESSYSGFQFVSWGPAWCHWWATGFIVVSGLAALGTKVILRIK